MKRLVEETTDELARSLLQAGIEHAPPPGNKARVIVAMGAGGALGMFSSNAFAWLSTTAGKVTAVSVAVGVAGAVWVAAPPARDARSSVDASEAAATVATVSNAPEAEGAEQGRAAATDGRASSKASHDALAANSPADGSQLGAGHPAPTAVPGEAVAEAEPAANEGSPEVDTSASRATTARAAKASGHRQSRAARRERAARRSAARSISRRAAAKEQVVASKPSELRRDGPPSAVETSPAGGALDEPSAERAALDTEVRLVDDMHSAARRNDREALSRFLNHYRAAFPDGQLKREVAEFAARLERPGTSIAQ